MNIFTLSFSLFLLMDSIGNVPIFLSVLKELEPARQRVIIFRELVMALFIMIGFYLLGDFLLDLLKISEQAVLISGGIILFIIAIKLIFPSQDGPKLYSGGKEPFLVPLAVPLVSGPAVLAAVVLYSHQNIPIWVCLSAIFIAWTATTLILIFSPFLKKVLGNRGLEACERFTGLLLILIAVQMFLNGIGPFLQAR